MSQQDQEHQTPRSILGTSAPEVSFVQSEEAIIKPRISRGRFYCSERDRQIMEHVGETRSGVEKGLDVAFLPLLHPPQMNSHVCQILNDLNDEWAEKLDEARGETA